MTADPHHTKWGDRLYLTEADMRWANRHEAWMLRHPEERTCPCGTVLSRYNLGKICGPCRKED